jgi:hypothetical protein
MGCCCCARADPLYERRDQPGSTSTSQVPRHAAPPHWARPLSHALPADPPPSNRSKARVVSEGFDATRRSVPGDPGVRTLVRNSTRVGQGVYGEIYNSLALVCSHVLIRTQAAD